MKFEIGQKYQFMELDGVSHEQDILIFGISVTGDLNIRIEGLEDLGPSLHSVDLLTAKEMVNDGIWVLVD